jgi:hypothetical protein
MNDVNKTKRLKLSKGDWVWIAFAILLFLGGGIAGLFFIFCVWFFVFSVRKCIASIKLSAERKKEHGRKRTIDVESTQNNESVIVEKQYSPSCTTEALNEAENVRHDANQRKPKKKVIKGPAYPTYTIPEVRSISRNEIPKRAKGMFTPASIGGYVSPSGGFVNYVRYSVKGKCVKTGKNKKYHYEAMSEAEAQAKAKEDGLTEPFKVQIEKMAPPSDSQHSYARSLDAVIPKGACKRDVTAILSRITEEDESPDPGLVSFAHAYGVCFSRFIGKNELFRMMVYQLKGAKLATLYAYAVYLQEMGGTFGDPRDTPIYEDIVECAKMVENDPVLLKSLEGRSSDDYENPNRGTKVYKAVSAYLLPKIRR